MKPQAPNSQNRCSESNKQASAESASYNGFRLDKDDAKLIHSSGEIRVLRMKSLSVFKLLASKNGNLVSKTELFDAIWPNCCVTPDSLVQCISEIRRALDDQQHQVLTTRPRLGYALLPDTTARSADDPPEELNSHSADRQKTRPSIDACAIAPLLGRSTELSQSLAWLKNQEQGGLLLIRGESGVGKTRLLDEVCTKAKGSWIVCHSTSYESGEKLAFFSLANWLREPAVYDLCRKLRSEQGPILSSVLPELASEYCSVQGLKNTKENHNLLVLYETVLSVFTSLSLPLLLVIDNLQWCDPETIGFLNYMATRKGRPDYAVLCSQRCDYIAAEPSGLLSTYKNNPGFLQLPLQPLNPQDSETLLLHLLSEHSEFAVKRQVLNIARGLPLQIMELARSALRCSQSGQPPELGARNFIHERFIALDPATREMLALCATFGRPFSAREVSQTIMQSQSHVMQILEYLWSRAYIEQIGADLYSLHDLIRKHIYEALTPMRRARFHLAIAESIESGRLNYDESLHSLAAYHYSQAGRPGDALFHHQSAAAYAHKHYAAASEILELEASIACLDRLPASTENTETRIKSLLNLGLARSSTLGWGAEPVGQAWHAAYQQVDIIDDIQLKARVLNTYDTFLRDRGNWRECEKIGDKAFPLRQQIEDPFLAQSLLSSRAALLLHTGFPAKALSLYTELISESSDDTIKASYKWFNSTHRIGALFRSAQCLWLLDRVEEGRQMCNKSLQLANTRSDPFHKAITLFHICLFHEFCRDFSRVLDYASELLSIAQRYGFNYYIGAAKLYIAYSRLHLNANPREIKAITTITRQQDAAGTKMFDTYWLSNLATASLICQDYSTALAVADEGLSRSRVSNNCFWDSELNRICGIASMNIQLKGNTVSLKSPAEYFRRAIAIAQKQGSISLLKTAERAHKQLDQSVPEFSKQYV